MGSKIRQRKPYHLQFSKAGHFTRKKPPTGPVRLRRSDGPRKADQRHLPFRLPQPRARLLADPGE